MIQIISVPPHKSTLESQPGKIISVHVYKNIFIMIRFSFILIVFISFFMLDVESQVPNQGSYGVHVSQAYASFDQGFRYNLKSNFENDRKIFEIGIILQNNQNILSGGEFTYKYLIGRNAWLNTHSITKRRFRPFVFYNFVYQRLSPFNGARLQKKSTAFNRILKNGGSVSLEHLGGIGLQIETLDNLFLETSLAYGAYIGGIDNQEMMYADVKNIGQAISVKIGIHYFLNHKKRF